MAKSKSNLKKKKNASQSAARLNPAEFLRAKARTLPLAKCYLGKDTDSSGVYQAIITRIRPSGNIVACFYVIDTYCFGLTDSFCRVNLPPEEWQDMLDADQARHSLEETPYETVHNLIYGAIEFAEEANLDPSNTFNITEYMLEEDTDDIPLVPVEFGRNGKHYLNIRHFSPQSLEVIKTLRNKLADGFEYEVSDPDAPHWLRYKHNNEPVFQREPFSYDYPPYPVALELIHQEIADPFLDPANLYSFPEDTKELLLALPPHEAASDIASIILFTIGLTYRDIMANSDEAIPNSALIHSLIFLGALHTDAALDAIIELIHQSADFIEAHLGDYATTLLPQALYQATHNHIDRLTALLDTPGIPSFNRFYVFNALVLHIRHNPVWRHEGLEIIRTHLKRLVTDLQATRACDSEYVGLIMPLLSELTAVELLPEIKAVFDTGLVDESICGHYDSFTADLHDENITSDELDDYSIDEQYVRLEGSRLIDEELL